MSVETYIFESLVAHLPFASSEDQHKLFVALASFLRVPAPVFILNGYAGTGKTTAMAALVGALNDLQQPTVLMAPTGRSAKVLEGYTGKAAHTIHRVIYRQAMPKAGEEADFGVFSLQPNKNRNTLYIVDEASLLSNTI